MQLHVATNAAITGTKSGAGFAHKMEQLDMRKCDWHVNNLDGESPSIALKGGNKKPRARASEETHNCYPRGNNGDCRPMRSLKEAGGASAI